MIRTSAIMKIGLLLTIVFAVTLLYNPQFVSAQGKPIFLYAAYNNLTSAATYPDYFATVRQLGTMLQDKIGRTVVVIVPAGDYVSSNEQVIDALANGRADIASLQTFAYMIAHESTNVGIVANPTVNGEPGYPAEFLTHNQTGIYELKDLDGVNLCWVGRPSMSGYIIPSLMLKAGGFTAGPGSRFVGSQNQVVSLIYSRQCTAGAVYVDARVVLQTQHPDVFAVERVVAISPSIPNPYGFSVADSVSPELRQSIATALVEIAKDPQGATLFQALGIQGLVQVDHSIFTGLEDLIVNAGMTPQEVWDTYIRQ